MPTSPLTHAQRRRMKHGRPPEGRPNSTQRGYGYRWQKFRKWFIRQNSSCVMCKAQGIVKNTEEIDHIIPHKGDYELMWDIDNMQGLCKSHHSRKTGEGK